MTETETVTLLYTLYLVTQALAHEAKLMNISEKSLAVVQPSAETDIAVANYRGPSSFGFSLGDEHFAISEAVLDEARSKAHGNWAIINQQEFDRDHGDYISGSDGESDDEEADGSDNDDCGTGCNCNFGFGGQQHSQLTEVLRLAKLKRKLEGWVPDHVLVVATNEDTLDAVMESDADNPCYLLGRVQFRPFDLTAISMGLTQEKGEILAKMQVTEAGLPLVLSFAQVLRDMALNSPDGIVKVISYRGKSFATLHVTSLDCVEACLARLSATKKQHRPDADTDSDSEERKAINKRLGLMKKLAAAKPNPAVKKQVAQKKGGGGSGRKVAAGPRHKKGPAASDPLPTEEASGSSSKAAQQDAQLAEAWEQSYEADALSARATSSGSKGAAPVVPEKQNVVVEAAPDNKPYKEASGHCFIRIGGEKPRHIGISPWFDSTFQFYFCKVYD